MYQTYIFDLYGTLVDICTDEEKKSFWKQMACYYSLQGAAYRRREFQSRYLALVKEKEASMRRQAATKEVEILLPEVFEALYLEKNVIPTPQLLQDTATAFRAASIRRLRLFPGVKKLLKNLKKAGKGVYLLSNAQRCFTEPEMRHLGIYGLFDGILYSSDAGVKKPAAQFYAALFEKFHLEKEGAVMVGNEPDADMQGAAAFGIAGYYVHTPQSPGTEKEAKKMLPKDCQILKSIRKLPV